MYKFFRRRQKKVTLVLGGGSARGIAHIGVMKVLEREKIPIDRIIGTSMGALIGAAYSVGVTVPQMEERAYRFTTKKLLDPTVPRMGLLAGDKILAVDGRTVSHGDALVAIINKRVQGSLVLTIERGGNVFKKEIKPVVEKRKIGFGSQEKEIQIARIGIQPAQKIEKDGYGFFGSVYMGVQTIWQITILTYKALGAMIIGKLSMKEMAGPVGIFMITAQAAKLGIIYLLNFMAILSASLAIFNLLPFPVLDGGHILFLAIEKLRGKPISMKTQEVIMNIGWSLLILFMVLIFYSDIMKFGIADKVMKLFK